MIFGGAPLIGIIAVEQSKRLTEQGHWIAAAIFSLVIAGILLSGGSYVLWRDRRDIITDLKRLWSRH
jgi:hypothetical protein